MKRSLYFLLTLFCICCTLSTSVWAQETVPSPASVALKASGSVTGILADSVSGKPIEYATVSLLRKGSTQSVNGTLTDERGQFKFSNVEVGDYVISISFIGYNTKTVPGLSVTEGAPSVVVGSVRLSETATKLQAVNVTALRPTITMEADKMVVSVEGTALAAGRTAFDVLAKAPGVFADQNGNLQLNGKAGVTVMLNGKQTYLSANDLRNMLEGMSAENIKNIEVITNPSSKYDAEGTSGILNINLKKNVMQGVNGSVYAGYIYNFKQYAYSTGFSLNHMKGNWNSFISLDQLKRAGNRDGTFTRVFYGDNGVTYFDQMGEGKNKNLGPPVMRVGTDYTINENHSVGAMVNYNKNTAWIDFLTDTYIGSEPDQPERYIEANNYTENIFSNLTSNLHYVGRLDTFGTTISADLDFVKIMNNGYSNFYNYYNNLVTNDPAQQDFLYTATDNGFDIYAAKIDFSKVLTKQTKFEVGAKASRVISDNDSRFYFNNETLELDPRRTNHFVYDERIYAAYVNFQAKLGEQYSLQVGLRAEQTQSEGKQLTTGEVNDTSYLNFFPSLFLQQKVSDNYQVSYSYSRRIQRPNYGNLNPFIIYRDPYTYEQGNPYLRPQYAHAFGVTQTIRKHYRLVLNYQFVQDVMIEVPILNIENGTTVYTTSNLDNSHNLSLAAVVPVRITKFWDTSNTANLSYNEFNAVVDDERIKNAAVLYTLQSNHNILLPFNFQLEINSAFRGPGVVGLYQIAPMWWMHFGLKKTFLDKKLQLSVNANDVFRTYRLRFDTRIGENINDYNQYFFGQNVGVTLRYNFSKGQKFDTKRRNNSLDEVNRAGGGS